MQALKDNEFCRLLDRTRGKIWLKGIYNMFIGMRQGQQVWVVDGDQVALGNGKGPVAASKSRSRARVPDAIYPAFVAGGNDERYRFNPPFDIWIDDRIGIEELSYTIVHEVHERALMRAQGWTYNKAHDAALALEKKLRPRDRQAAARHSAKHADRLKGLNVYRRRFGKINGVTLWIVDGSMVREFLDGDFLFGSNGFTSQFIPGDEIWLDSAMAVTRALLTIASQLKVRSLMEAGNSYAQAYPQGVLAEREVLLRHKLLAERHEAGLEPVTYGAREYGGRTSRAHRPRRRH